jgi:hypothetical protein
MWQLDGPLARWQTADWQVGVKVAHPGEGLTLGGYEDTVLQQARVLQTGPTPAQPPRDVYVRGRDLIITFAEDRFTPVETRISWRVLSDSDRGHLVVDLLVARQTSLLDSDPAIDVASTLPGHDACWLAADVAWTAPSPATDETLAAPALDAWPAWSALLWRLPHATLSYAQLFHTVDLCSLSWSHQPASDTSTLTTTLFRERLEKGVVRQAWLRGIWLPRASDREVAVEHCRQVDVSAPPLTT